MLLTLNFDLVSNQIQHRTTSQGYLLLIIYRTTYLSIEMFVSQLELFGNTLLSQQFVNSTYLDR